MTFCYILTLNKGRKHITGKILFASVALSLLITFTKQQKEIIFFLECVFCNCTLVNSVLLTMTFQTFKQI